MSREDERHYESKNKKSATGVENDWESVNPDDWENMGEGKGILIVANTSILPTLGQTLCYVLYNCYHNHPGKDEENETKRSDLHKIT